MKKIYQLGKVLALTCFLVSAIACGGDHSHGEETTDEEKKKHGEETTDEEKKKHGHSHSSS